MADIKGTTILPDLPKSENDYSDWQGQLAARNYDFETQIDNIVVKTEARLLAVIRGAIDDLVNEAQTPTVQGGKMRVDTGFLRHSGISGLNAPPVGETIGRDRTKGETGAFYTWNGEAIGVTLLKMKLGDTFYFGWTAHYAKYREAFDGFLESAIQKWQGFVDKRVAYYRNKDGV